MTLQVQCIFLSFSEQQAVSLQHFVLCFARFVPTTFFFCLDNFDASCRLHKHLGFMRLRQGDRAVFGVRILRFSRYYLQHLVTICHFSSFSSIVYLLPVDAFHNRAKVLVGVLLVQMCAKMSVGSKLPRIARTTAFERCALASLSLLFGIFVTTAFCKCLVNSALSSSIVETLDVAMGCALFLCWILYIVRIGVEARGVVRTALNRVSGVLPEEGRISCDFLEPEAQASDLPPFFLSELRALRTHSTLARTSSTRVHSVDRKAGRDALTSSKEEPLLERQVYALSTRIWDISNIDVSASTFEVKFHVFLAWNDPVAVDLPEGNLADDVDIDVPHAVISNAVCIMNETHMQPKILDSQTGRCSCRTQFHVRCHTQYDLSVFPFDCQSLEVAFTLKGRREWICTAFPRPQKKTYDLAFQ